MARNNHQVSPEVAKQLVDLARQVRLLIDGIPEWRTKFAQIKDDALEVGREVSRLTMR